MKSKHNVYASFIAPNLTTAFIQSTLSKKLSDAEVYEIMTNFVNQAKGKLVLVKRYDKKNNIWNIIRGENK